MIDGIALEQTVIGQALNDSRCFQYLVSNVGWEEFAAPNHRVIVFCLHRMSDHGIAIPDEDTFQLVVDAFPEKEKDYGGSEYIRNLKKAFTEKTDNYKYFIERLKLQAAKANLGGKYLEKILRVLNSPLTSIEDVREKFDDAVSSLDNLSIRENEIYSAKQISNLYIEELDKRASRVFATTGLMLLDEYLTEGFLPTKLTVMAGFTGMAKSTMVAAMAHRIASKGTGTCIFSMETQKEGVWDKIVSSLTQIPIKRLKKESASLNVDERNRIENALASLSGIPLYINDRASMSMAEMRNRIKTAQRSGNDIHVVFVDLFGKLEDVDSGDNLAQKIQQKCKEMRVMAQYLNVHFVMVVQIGRQGFGRDRQGRIRRPILTDIKNANSYAEEADIVLLLHRNRYYLPELLDDILEVHIAKQREGEAGTVCYFEMFADRATVMATTKMPHDIE